MSARSNPIMPPPDELSSHPLPIPKIRRRASKERTQEESPDEIHADSHTVTDTDTDTVTVTDSPTKAAPLRTAAVIAVRRRLVGGIITVVACLTILRASVVAWRMAEDKQPTQREMRELEITRWMDQVHANPQARVLSIGDAKHTFWTSNFTVDVLISEPNKPGDQGYSFVALTFDTTGKIIGSTVKQAQ